MSELTANTYEIQDLAGLIQQQTLAGSAPVEMWDPPYRGDIGLAIRGDGAWFYKGSVIARPALVKLFSRVLRRDEDGRYYLVTPAERVDVLVEDAPFLAVEMQIDGDGEAQQITFRTNVDDIVRCGPEHPLKVAVDPVTQGLKPYVTVRGRLRALLSRPLSLDLVELALAAEQDAPDGNLGIWSGGLFFPLSDHSQ